MFVPLNTGGTLQGIVIPTLEIELPCRERIWSLSHSWAVLGSINFLNSKRPTSPGPVITLNQVTGNYKLELKS